MLLSITYVISEYLYGSYWLFIYQICQEIELMYKAAT